MNKDKITILFFENTKWYMLLAKIIQHASHKIYPYEINLINHVAFVYRDYVYEFKFSKNFVKTKFQ